MSEAKVVNTTKSSVCIAGYCLVRRVPKRLQDVLNPGVTIVDGEEWLRAIQHPMIQILLREKKLIGPELLAPPQEKPRKLRRRYRKG